MGQSIRHMLELSFGNEMIISISKFIYMGSGSMYGTYWGIIQDIYDFIKIIGYALIVTFFLKAILQEATKDNLTIEQLIKCMIGLILSVTVIEHIPEITNAFLQISDSIAFFILDPVTQADGSKVENELDTTITTAIDAFVEDNGGLIGWLRAAFMWLVHQLAVIGFDFAIITRAFDIGWKVCIAPVSCADMFDGANSGGVKHLKSLFGSALAVAMIAIAARVGQGLIISFLSNSNAESGFFMALATQVAMAGVAIGINNKAKEILG